MDDKSRIKKIIELLNREYPNAKTPLKHKNPFQLLVATILSAQCTDKRVNMVTPKLFKKYKSVKDFANARQSEIEGIIKSTGFYRNKTKSIIGAAKALLQNHGGKVPKDLEAMVKLPGIGRKTANVVLGEIYDIPGVVVDTHVKRLINRIGLTSNKNPEKIERDLMNIVPKENWSLFSILLIFHGRNICKARKPLCCNCVIQKYCPSNECDD